MMMMVHHDNHGRPDQRRDGGDGPTCNRPPGVAEPVAGSSSNNSTRGGSVLRGLQPFQYSSNTNTHHHNSTSLRSPGGMTTAAAAALGFPFTNQQWKELERQAMIYKYMMASLPVPRDLLFPTTASSSSISQSPLSGGGFNLRLSNSTDPEPGRCKRTDGKKWRCSRDVAPDQKYCGRHLHRGRPRSRKHVEIHANNTAAAAATMTTAKKLRRDNNSNNIPPICAHNLPNPEMSKNGYPTQFFGSTLQPFHQTPVYLDKSGVRSATFGGGVHSVSSHRGDRGMEWMMKSEAPAISSSDAQWQDLMQSNKTELSSCSRIPYLDENTSIFGQRSEQESYLNLNSYTSFNAGDAHHHQQDDNDCTMFLSPDVVGLENPLLEETPRSFIDAWSKNDNGDNITSVPSSGHLSPSSLTLSMGGYNSRSDEMGQTHMSLGCNDGSGNETGPPQISTWLTPSSWVSSPPGGPLAEVLKPATSAVSTPSSPITTNGNHGEFSSPLGTTTVSSPSGVLQKTLASFSDSSGNSSPNLTSSKSKTEAVSLWLNQSKA
ncbi:hypothetical protein ACLB2K_070867 [Fragaria x ananassa]